MKKPIFVAVFFAFIPFVTFASFDKDLKYGSVGAPVVELQEFLMEQGFLNVPSATGNFFSVTLKAVKAFQEKEGLPPTGFVGPLTRGKINAHLASAIGASDEQEASETGTVAPAVVQCPVGYTCSKGTDDAINRLAEQVNTLQNELKKQTAVQEQIRDNTVKVVKTPAPTPAPQPVVIYGLRGGTELPRVYAPSSDTVFKGMLFYVMGDKNIDTSSIKFNVSHDEGVETAIVIEDEQPTIQAGHQTEIRVRVWGKMGQKYSIANPHIKDIEGNEIPVNISFPINGEL